MKKIISAGALCLCLFGLLIVGCSEPYVDSEKTYTVTFFPNGGIVSGKSEINEKTSKDTDTRGRLSSLPSATRGNGTNADGETISFAFTGWFTPGGTEVSTRTVFHNDTLVLARWRASDEKDTEEPGPLANWLAFTRDSDVPPTLEYQVNADERLKPQTLAFGGQQVTFTLHSPTPLKIQTLSISGFGALFTVEKGVTLILENIHLEGGRNTASLITVNDGGKLIIRDGTLISDNGNENKDYGGGVTVNIGGVCEMTGGKITRNTSVDPTEEYFASPSGGGGVFVRGGKFTMTGGQIAENTAVNGGGVLVRRGGIFTMGPFTQQGTTDKPYIPIYKNVSYEGGGVKVIGGRIEEDPDATPENTVFTSRFNMIGGRISENRGGGGGVAVGMRGIFTMRNGEISHNEGSDAAGLFNRAGGIVYIHDGKITENRAPWSAGGVLNSGYMYLIKGEISKNYGGLGGGVVNGGRFYMWGGKISENIGDGSGGAIANTGQFHMYYGKIYGNTANIGLGGGLNNGTASSTYAGIFYMTGGIIYGKDKPENSGTDLIDDPAFLNSNHEYFYGHSDADWKKYQNEDHGSGGQGGALYVLNGTAAWGRRGWFDLDSTGAITFTKDTRFERNVSFISEVAVGVPEPASIDNLDKDGNVIGSVPYVKMNQDLAKLITSNKTIRVDDFGVFIDGRKKMNFTANDVVPVP